MPSQSNEMLSYDVFSDNSHLTTCSEGDNLFHEESGKYDLDTVSVFVAKLYHRVRNQAISNFCAISFNNRLLDGDEYKEYLTWNETGDVFVICNMDEFAQNIYGFYRVSDARKSKHVRSKHACVFSHSQFRRGRQDLLPNIRRKVAKSGKRKSRPSEPLLSQNQSETNTVSSPPSVYGSPVNSKNGSITKDSPSQYMLNSFPESKDLVTHADKSDSEDAMRKRIAELTAITENLRKDLKNMSDIVNERLLPEVRSLTEDLHKHQVHLMHLTHLVAYHSSPEDIQLLPEVSRGYTRHMPSHDIPPAKRARLDNKQTASVKMERSNLSSSTVINAPTVPSSVANASAVPSSSVPSSYDTIFASHSDNNLMNSPTSPIIDHSVQGAPSVSQPLTMPTDSHPAYNIPGSPIIGNFQSSSHNDHSCLTGFNESWSSTCHSSVLMSDSVNAVPNSFLFQTTNSNQSPILYSPSSNPSPHSRHEQLSSPAPSAAPPMSPTKYGDGTATTAHLISNSVTTASSTNGDRHNEVIVAVSPPPSTTSSSPISQPTTSITNYYQPPMLEMYNSYSNY
ncbi:6486_t:CDS:2 [Acaulospora colombiana]|uniref:6486_t:CDS:1 n=1 Tax=Acaulospora colombiana TaxID=27376 RepID=A0ACA9K9P0_9GLOM|nr:6486_t:CDS:2 [Acaulospora colombiana]